MARYIARITSGIAHALTNTPGSVGIDRRAVRRLSRHLAATLMGLFVMTRAQVPPAILDDVVSTAVAQIDAFARENGIPTAG